MSYRCNQIKQENMVSILWTEFLCKVNENRSNYHLKDALIHYNTTNFTFLLPHTGMTSLYIEHFDTSSKISLRSKHIWINTDTIKTYMVPFGTNCNGTLVRQQSSPCVRENEWGLRGDLGCTFGKARQCLLFLWR